MATRNPHFDVHQKAIQSVHQIKRVCMGLESLQCAAGLFALTIAWMGAAWTPLMHMYTLILYFFLTIFSHVVFFYVISALEKNIWSAYTADPLRVNNVLPLALRKHRRRVMPLLLAHGLSVFCALLFWAMAPQAHQNRQKFAVGAAVIASCFLLGWIRYLLKRNTNLVSSFIISGGYSGVEKGDV